jgi:uncharacterized protein (DUF1015 family)
MEERGRRGHVFGLYTGGETFTLLTLKDPGVAERLTEGDGSRGAQALDVVVLQDLIFQRLLQLTDPEMIRFTQDEEMALREVRHGRAAAAFFLNPIPVTQIAAAVSSGQRLPPKSTYFYPKLLSGLVFCKVDPGESLDVSTTSV